MRYLVFILAIACGRHEGVSKVQHLVARDGQSEEAAMIFAARQPNDQYCFYEKSVGSDKLLKIHSDPENIRKNLQAWSRNSVLLTPRSLVHKDVRAALMADSKAHNVVSHLLHNRISIPLSLSCFVSAAFFIGSNISAAVFAGPAGVALNAPTMGKIAAATCGTEITLYAGAYLLARSSKRESGYDIAKLISPRLYGTSPEKLASLRKTFSWLESRDATECPAKLQLQPAATRVSKEGER